MLLVVGLISAALGFLVPALVLLFLAFRTFSTRSRSAAAVMVSGPSPENADSPNYDARRWLAFTDADSEMSAAARAVSSLGPDGRLQLLKTYLAFGDRHYLGGLVRCLNGRFISDSDPYAFAADQTSRGRMRLGIGF